jgi:hypothetical protein
MCYHNFIILLQALTHCEKSRTSCSIADHLAKKSRDCKQAIGEVVGHLLPFTSEVVGPQRGTFSTCFEARLVFM